jgi:hypothetical protein
MLISHVDKMIALITYYISWASKMNDNVFIPIF